MRAKHKVILKNSNEELVFPSILETAKFLNCSPATIVQDEQKKWKCRGYNAYIERNERFYYEGIPVSVYGVDGELKWNFNSYGECAKFFNITTQQVYYFINSRHKRLAQYFIYPSSEKNPVFMRRKCETPKTAPEPRYHFKIYNLNGEEVFECYSLVNAANFIGCTDQAIRYTLNKDKKQVFDFIVLNKNNWNGLNTKYIVSKFGNPPPLPKQRRVIVKYDANKIEIAIFKNITELAAVEKIDYNMARFLVGNGLPANNFFYKKELKEY